MYYKLIIYSKLRNPSKLYGNMKALPLKLFVLN